MQIFYKKGKESNITTNIIGSNELLMGVKVTLVLELRKIKESTVEELNDAIRKKINASLIKEYPVTGVHQFYTEFFQYHQYGYNVEINMFFDIHKIGKVDCCKDSLFLSVTPCKDSVILFRIVNVSFKSRNPVCFTQCIKDNEIENIVYETHLRAKNQIDILLNKMQLHNEEIYKIK